MPIARPGTASPGPARRARPQEHPHGQGVGWFKKSICTLFSLALINTLAMPLTQAMQIERHKQALQELATPSPAEHYAQALAALGLALAGDDAHTRPSATQRPSAPAPALAELAPQLARHAQHLQQQWDELRQGWADAGVDAAILARQRQIEADFASQHRQLMALLREAAAQPASARQALADFVQTQRPRPSQLPLDLNHLPWQVLRPSPQAPAHTPQQLEQNLLPEPETPPASAQASTTRAGKTQTTPTQAPAAPRPISYRLAIDADADAAAPSNASTKSAQSTLAKPTLSKTASAPTAADLAATPEAPHSPQIQALAQSLGGNPFKIHQWVHDHIHFHPSHGSVQGAQDTLDKQRGNAYDTASLLIALLRSSGIPARYVYGTVDIPIAQVQNWVGGAATAHAAQQILGQGGVPNVILTRGGVDVAFRLEHVWVEALIQYHPGRGTRHVPGQSQPDAWVPLDASFKQFDHSSGMDLQAAVPFDAHALLAAAQQGARINEAEGWVQHLNTQAVDSQLRTYQNQLKAHIQSQNGGNSTVGDVLGTRKPRIYALPYLAGTLPYAVRARAAPMSEIPARHKAQFQYAIYADQRSAAWGDGPLLQWQAPTAEIAGKKLTIAWVAATPADQQAIEALIPTPAPGQELDPSQLPQGLPSSIHLKPEIRLDGQTVATGSAMRAGAEPVGVGGFTRYGSSNQWDTSRDQLIAGQQTAIGLSIQGISQGQMQRLKERMEATKQKLEQAQAAPVGQRPHILQGITGEHLTGDMLTATVWGYFASLQSYGAIAGSQAQVIDLPALQYGLFHAQVQPRKPFGLVTTGISFKGLNMDIGHVRSIRWVKDDDPNSPINNKPELTQNGKTAAQNRWIVYNKTKGQYSSAMEHAIPEEFLIDSTKCSYIDSSGLMQNPSLQSCTEGISAIKILAAAQREGQRIYTIDQKNRETALPALNIAGDVGAEIRSAIAADKEAFFHESRINAHGWSGYGYIIIDPETGSGAYLIEGKGSGGYVDDGYWSRYLHWTSENLISFDDPTWNLLLLFISPLLKKWIGISPRLLGVNSPATSVLSAIEFYLTKAGIAKFGLRTLGRYLAFPLGLFIGFYNFTILIQGFFYAKRIEKNKFA
ncbi:transglutaminase domain-containing protein [Vandammella animalimorsus]|uniref:transglutaminase domain-containing protein n=1 Tax=Vandammella animalimorsus TaxID=2029117 RepID=UPI00325BB127